MINHCRNDFFLIKSLEIVSLFFWSVLLSLLSFPHHSSLSPSLCLSCFLFVVLSFLPVCYVSLAFFLNFCLSSLSRSFVLAICVTQHPQQKVHEFASDLSGVELDYSPPHFPTIDMLWAPYWKTTLLGRFNTTHNAECMTSLPVFNRPRRDVYWTFSFSVSERQRRSEKSFIFHFFKHYKRIYRHLHETLTTHFLPWKALHTKESLAKSI